MTDTTVAPPTAAPPAAVPSPELVVEPNPTSSPTPVGSQAPDKPPGAEPPKRTRMDSVKAAFERATKQQDERAQRQPRQAPQETKAPAAEARAGHNQPPEATPKTDRYREGGRFARNPNNLADTGATSGSPGKTDARVSQGPGPAQVPGQPGPGQPGQVVDQTGRPYKLLPENAPYREPLKRMSDAAKHAWADTPEPVRASLHRMAQEFSKAYQAQKADVETFKPLKPYHELAKSQGTNLETALSNYISIEHQLRTDLVGGLDKIVNNLAREQGLKGENGQLINLRDVAYHILNMSPDQHQLVATRNAQSAAEHQLGALYQKISGLENAFEQMYAAQRYTQTRGAVDHFADQHPRLDELSGAIAREISLGFSLDEAYRRADLLYPPTQAAQTRTTSAQTRTEDRSIYGAPDGGGSATADARTSQRTKGQPPSRRDAIRNAIRRVQGGI